MLHYITNIEVHNGTWYNMRTIILGMIWLFSILRLKEFNKYHNQPLTNGKSKLPVSLYSRTQQISRTIKLHKKTVKACIKRM